MNEAELQNYHTHTLSNGLKLIFKPDNCAVSYCGLVINTGSRDESEQEHGMAHFIEHMLFKGTTKRRSAHIINRLEHVGGELNAFTSKEETVIYAAVLTEYTERALELIADIAFNSIFPQKEIEKEIEVILDEIQSYNDSPSELIYDDFEELLFEGHTLAHNILGNPNVLKSLNTQIATSYILKNYQQNEMVLFVTGNSGFDQIKRWAVKHFDIITQNGTKTTRIAPATNIPRRISIEKNTHQVHFIVGNIAYNMYHPDRMGMYLLNNILGGPGMNSLLNLSLREKHGLAYHVESSYQPFTDTGMWTVYFGCDPDNAAKCEELVYTELSKLREQKITESALKKYKLQLMGQMAIASENKESLALSIGKSFMRYGKIDSLDTVRQTINNLTAEHLQRIACEIFDQNKFSSLTYK